MTMRVWGLWWGGPNYAQGDRDRDVEVFDSITDLRAAFVDRYAIGRVVPQNFRYANREHECMFTPLVDAETSSFVVWFYDPTDGDDAYPDRLVYFGPRGGLRTQQC